MHYYHAQYAVHREIYGTSKTVRFYCVRLDDLIEFKMDCEGGGILESFSLIQEDTGILCICMNVDTFLL